MNDEINPDLSAYKTGQIITSQGPGRPPISTEPARSKIQLRVTMARKNAYVKAAKPGKLTAWIFKVLDAACGFKAGEVGEQKPPE